eukprot:EG_transcript_31336
MEPSFCLEMPGVQLFGLPPQGLRHLPANTSNSRNNAGKLRGGSASPRDALQISNFQFFLEKAVTQGRLPLWKTANKKKPKGGRFSAQLHLARTPDLSCHQHS